MLSILFLCLNGDFNDENLRGFNATLITANQIQEKSWLLDSTSSCDPEGPPIQILAKNLIKC